MDFNCNKCNTEMKVQKNLCEECLNKRIVAHGAEYFIKYFGKIEKGEQE